MLKDKSPIDEFFYGLYGYYPNKSGQAYELIVNGVLKLLNSESEVIYDQYIEGSYSKQKYQIDGVVGDKKIVEAKDYTIRGAKVGRPDVQKQEGAIIDLPHDEGIFASATDYTKPAKLYAKGTITNPVTKKLELYNIRPSTIDDEEGRTKTIILEIFIKSLNLEEAKYSPTISQTELEKISKLFQHGEYKISIGSIYNKDGSKYQSIKDWTRSLSSEYSLDDEKTELKGETVFSGKFIAINETLIEISEMKYKIPISTMSEVIKIEQDGKACLYVCNEDGTVDTLLTDVQMKDLKFEDGQVKYKGTI